MVVPSNYLGGRVPGRPVDGRRTIGGRGWRTVVGGARVVIGAEQKKHLIAHQVILQVINIL